MPPDAATCVPFFDSHPCIEADHRALADQLRRCRLEDSRWRRSRRLAARLRAFALARVISVLLALLALALLVALLLG